MSRLRDQLFDAKIENTTLKLELEALRREVEGLRAQAAEAQDLRVKNAVLLERLDLLANHLPPAPSQAFNHINEEVEDADFALSSGFINQDEYEAILASAGALNTEIAFDSSTPRL